ncbi:MAG: AI-2E family transporter [Bacteroidales bacterium]|nr:AI-2E family transporter [Bacteroidales bacterium]
MPPIIKNIKPFLVLALAAFLIWYFSDLVIYISISVVLSIIGRPLKNFYLRVKIKKFKIGNVLAALMSLLTMLMVVAGFFIFLVPLIISQASLVSSIDMNLISAYFQEPILDLYEFLNRYNLIDNNQDIATLIDGQIRELMDFASFTNIFGQLLSTTGSVFMALFIILFLTFFFLKDPEILKNFILEISPESYSNKMKKILTDSRYLLSRYFIGVLIEVASMMVIISTVLSILGIHNAILIGFIGGLFNIIPYLGPIIGASIGLILGIIYVLAFGLFDQIGFTAVAILSTFAAANLVDNFLLQPIIYSKSVKAHPIEIFLVIIMAGKLAGIVGMIAAIPVYTVAKVIYRQFSSEKIINKLEKNVLEKEMNGFPWKEE